LPAPAASVLLRRRNRKPCVRNPVLLQCQPLARENVLDPRRTSDVIHRA